MERVAAIDRELRDSGAWVFSRGLNGPDTATVLRPQGDAILTTDGPFVGDVGA